MNRRLKQPTVVFAAAQLIRPECANPATDASRTIQAQVGRERDARQDARTPERRLSPQDVEMICAAAREAEAEATGR